MTPSQPLLLTLFLTLFLTLALAIPAPDTPPFPHFHNHQLIQNFHSSLTNLLHHPVHKTAVHEQLPLLDQRHVTLFNKVYNTPRNVPQPIHQTAPNAIIRNWLTLSSPPKNGDPRTAAIKPFTNLLASRQSVINHPIGPIQLHTTHENAPVTHTIANDRRSVAHAFTAHFNNLAVHSLMHGHVQKIFTAANLPHNRENTLYTDRRILVAHAAPVTRNAKDADDFISLWAFAKAGLTLDPCQSDKDCKGDRQCLTPEIQPCTGSQCICIPPQLIVCSSTTDCPDGEECVVFDTGDKFCISEQFLSAGPSPIPESSPIAPPPGDGLKNSPCFTDEDCKGKRQCLFKKKQLCDARSNCTCGRLRQRHTDPDPFEPTIQPSSGPYSTGLTFDPCSVDADCQGDRTCLSTPDISCIGGESCVCVPESFIVCTTSDVCPIGEVCAIVGPAQNFCVSEQQVTPVEPPPLLTETAQASPGPDDGGGLTLDICRDSKQCQGDRTCVNTDLDLCSASDLQCRCVPAQPVVCVSDSDCVVGEVCVKTGSDFVCISEQVISETPELPSPSPIASGPPGGGSGLTLDPCLSTSDCQGDRECLNQDVEECSGNDACFCIPPFPISCVSSSECPAGEVCVTVQGAGDFCVSENAVSPPEPQPTSTSTSIPGGGLTADPCRTDGDCQGDRKCRDVDGLCSITSDFCFCFPDIPIFCTSSIECPEGEVCAILDSDTDIIICVSEDFAEREGLLLASPVPSPTTSVPSPSIAPGNTSNGDTLAGNEANADDNGESACVDAAALAHIDRHDLVFSEHVQANVLCDSNNSCATAGHIVSYNGKAMMMRSYCETAGCSRKRILVNSPSYKMRMRVPSKTEGLEFTAFAARYETRMEEVLLRTAVRAGL